MIRLAGLVPRGLAPRGRTACLVVASLAFTAARAAAALTLDATYPASLTAAAIGADGSVYTCNRDGIVKRSPDLVIVYEVNLAHHEGNNLSTFTCAAIAVAPDGSVVAVGNGIRTTVIKQRNAIKDTPEPYDQCGLTQLCTDGIVFRLDPRGELVLGTYVGVDGFIDELTDVAIMPDGDAVVGGRTFAATFPTTTGVIGETSKALPSPGVADGVLLRFSARGTLKWSTFIGGQVGGVAAHPSGDVVVSLDAKSAHVPWQASASAPAFGAVGHLARITADGAGVAWATLLPDLLAVYVGPVATDAFGNVYATGNVDAAYVTMFTGMGVPVWTTRLPGHGQTRVADLAIRQETGEILLTGNTTAVDFSTNPSSAPRPHLAQSELTFVATLSAAGQVRDATVLQRTRFNNGFPSGPGDAGVAVDQWTQGRILVASTHYNQEGRLLILQTPPVGAAAAVAVSPSTGGAAGGGVVQLPGGPFDEGSMVFFGGVPSPRVTPVHAGLLEAVTPAGTGPMSVTVITATGARTTQPAGFTYIGQACTPAIGDDQWRPGSGGGGVEVSSIGCLGTPAWSTAAWLTATAQANSTLRLDAQPNPGDERVGLAWHGTRAVRVVQGPGACGLDLQPLTIDVGPESVVVPLRTKPLGNCYSNTAGTPPSWIHAGAYAGGQYSADDAWTRRVTIDANGTGADRVGTITLVAQPRDGWPGAVTTRQVTVTQRASAGCTPGVAPALAVGADGGACRFP